MKIHSFGIIDRREIEKFEDFFSISLPPRYKKFLEQNNGGIPTPDCFDFYDESDSSILDYFFGINLKENYCDLGYNFNVFKNRIPCDLFPIASDPGGNIILIGLSGDESGKIYFWDHEFEADGYAPDMSNVHLIAPNLDTFLNNLYEFKDDEL